MSFSITRIRDEMSCRDIMVFVELCALVELIIVKLHFYKQSICFYTKLTCLENTITFHTVHDSCRIGTIH